MDCDKSELINSILKNNKGVRKIYNLLNDTYLKHGFNAYKENPIFRGLLIAEIKKHNEKLKALT